MWQILTSNTISMYSINANGTLMPLSPESTVVTQGFPIAIQLDPAGQYVYVPNGGSSTVSIYKKR